MDCFAEFILSEAKGSQRRLWLFLLIQNSQFKIQNCLSVLLSLSVKVTDTKMPATFFLIVSALYQKSPLFARFSATPRRFPDVTRFLLCRRAKPRRKPFPHPIFMYMPTLTSRKIVFHITGIICAFATYFAFLLHVLVI